MLRPSTTRPTATTATSRSRSTPTSRSTRERTMEQAREYWGRVDRPNVMIKIPGTDEGLPAIEQMTYEGMQRQRHAAVQGRALRARAPRPTSAASSAASRRARSLDVALRRLVLRLARRHRGRQAPREAGRATSELLGTAGVANARAAYQRFKEIFHGERFAAPAAAGAPRAAAAVGVDRRRRTPPTRTRCTSTTSIAPDTVNTMPMATLLAAAERARRRGPARRPPTRAEDLAALAAPASTSSEVTDQAAARRRRRSS